MGWKAFVIIVQQPTHTEHEAVLRALGYGHWQTGRTTTFDAAIYPARKRVYVGTYKNNLVICAEAPSTEMIEQADAGVGKRLMELYPASDICAMVLQSVVNGWGYAVFKDGQRIRARMGDADNGTYLDAGAPLPEELPLLAKATLNNEGKRLYRFDDLPEAAFTEDQVGENFVFALWSRYFGQALDEADDELFDMQMQEYLVDGANRLTGDVLKPWWKFW